MRRSASRGVRSALGGDDFDLERGTASDDRKQAVDIGVRARTVARVGGVLGKDGQAVFGLLRVQGAEGLFQVLVHGKRALLARLVFYAGDYSAVPVGKVYAPYAINGWH